MLISIGYKLGVFALKYRICSSSGILFKLYGAKSIGASYESLNMDKVSFEVMIELRVLSDIALTLFG